jgi:hypothetical protein
MEQLEQAFSSNGSVSPFEQGAGWVGTWTLPVCDMGTNNWNTLYGIKPTRFGLMPCCCGINFPFLPLPFTPNLKPSNILRVLGPSCSETKDFIQAANMQGFQTVLHACQAQLQQTSIDYNSVDFGIKWKRSYPLRFAVWSTWRRGLSVLGIIFTAGIALPFLWFV